MKRKFLAIMLSVVCAFGLTFSLTACGNTENPDPNKSAYEAWLESGHEGTEEDFLNWIQNGGDKSDDSGDNSNDNSTDNPGDNTGDGSGDNSNNDPDDSNTPDDPEIPDVGYDGSYVEITFLNSMGASLNSITEAAIEEFNKLYPNIKVNSVPAGTYDALFLSIDAMIDLGLQPNVAFCYSDHVAVYNQKNAVLALDDFLPGGAYKDITVEHADETTEPLGLTQAQADDYVEAFFAEGSVYGDGKTYTLPFAKSTEVMYYNKTFFETNNLKVPATWEEMEEVCAQILQLAPGCTPLAYDSEANLFITLSEQYNAPYTSATGDHFLFDNQRSHEIVEMIYDWYNNGYLVTQSTGGGYTSTLFSEGSCMMAIGSTGGAAFYNPAAVDGQEVFEVGVVPIPQADADNPKSILQGPSVCIFKQDDPMEEIASWLLVKYLTTNIEYQAQYSKFSGYIPATKSVYNSANYQEHLKDGGLIARTALLCRGLIESNAFFTSPAFVGSAKAREQVGLLVTSVLLDLTTIDEAFQYALEECKRYA